MLKIKPAYRFPLLCAVTLHVFIIALLLVDLPVKHYRLPGPVAKREVIQAQVISQSQVRAVFGFQQREQR